MLFSSPVFLYLFLPLLLVAYYLPGMGTHRFRNMLLLVASLLFYTWGETFYVLVLLTSIAVNYVAGLLIERYREHDNGRWLLGFFVAINLMLLGTYKYANFLVDNLNVLLGLFGIPPLELAPVHLPIGISFYTFQALSYLIDVWRRTVRAQTSLIDLALYTALFPQLVAGPIVRYNSIEDQLKQRSVRIEDFYQGIRRFVFGLAKKMLIANPMGQVANQIFAIPGNDLSTPLAWLGILAYSLQLYFDFSAYSCMAIGLGRMFGFHFPENFNYPYIARSVQEFWRRWHMTLSNWFRDYLYIPLGGNRAGPVRTYFNLLLVFFLCGLWHGASWNFVIWGLFHGGFLVLERLGLGTLLTRLWRPLCHLYTLLVVMVAWVFFRAETLPQALEFLQAMAGFGVSRSMSHNVGFFLDNEFLITLFAALVFIMPTGRWLSTWVDRADIQHARKSGSEALTQSLAGLTILCVFFLCSLYTLSTTYNPFIYFRF